MAVTDVQIANMALGNIGVSKKIASLTTEVSDEADQCNLYYTPSVESTLEDFPWPEATGYQALGLVQDFRSSVTAHDWDFSYRYPTDCLMVRRIVTNLARQDPNPPPFRIGKDATGRLVYTNQEAAVAECTMRLTDPNLFSALFVDAVSWRLAASIAPALSRIKGMQQTALAMYVAFLGKARVKAANEQQQVTPPESDFIRARD